MDLPEESTDVHKFFNALDTTIDFLSRLGWRVTKQTSTGVWEFVQPHLAQGTKVIGDKSKTHWIMMKSKTGDVWNIVQPKITNHTVTKVTQSAFKLVKDSTTGTWKLVAPAVKPTGNLIAEHAINIGGHVFKLAWNKSKDGWQFVSQPFSRVMDATKNHFNKYFPKSSEMIGQGYQNVSDTVNKSIGHARSRIS